MARESSRDITARLKVAGAVLFRGELKDAAREVQELDKATARSGMTARRSARDWDSHSRALRTFGRTAANVGKVELLTTAVTGLGGEAVVALGAIGSLSGALSAIPALAIGAGSALGVLKLSFLGLGDAIKAMGDPSTTAAQMKKALAGLSPEAVAFARQVVGAQQQIKGLRSTAQAALFPGLSRGLSTGLPALLPLGRTAVTGVGGALGAGGSTLGSTLATSGVQRDLRTAVGGNNAALSTLVGGVGPATQTLARFAAILAPIEQELAKAAVNSAVFLNQWTGTHTHEIQTFFEHGLHDAHELAIGLGHLGSAIGNVFGASNAAHGGRDVFDSFASLTDSIQKWTSSSKGQHEMTDFFTKVTTTVHDIGPSVGSIAEDFLKLGTAISTGPFVVGLQTLGKFADLLTGLPKPVREILATSAGLAYVGSKLGLGSVGGSLLSKVPVLGPLVGGGGGLGTQGNPMYVRVVGSKNSNNNHGFLGGGLFSVVKDLAKKAKFAGLGALAEPGILALLGGAAPALAAYAYASGGTQVVSNGRGQLRTPAGALDYGNSIAVGPTGAALPDDGGSGGAAMSPGQVSHLGWYDTHYRFHVGAVPAGYVRAGTGPAGSGAGGYPLYQSRANQAGTAAAASIGAGLAAGQYPDLERRIAAAIAKAPINVYLDSKRIASETAAANSRAAANR